jgi:hypothetical protein
MIANERRKTIQELIAAVAVCTREVAVDTKYDGLQTISYVDADEFKQHLKDMLDE